VIPFSAERKSKGDGVAIWKIGVLACIVGVIHAQPAAAQTNEEIFQQFQWNFSTPGARAAGMGQAFVGVADDATAAVTNPAGLMRLTRPQIYAEFKRIDTRVERLASPSSLVTRQTTTFGTPTTGVSFLNVAVPIGSRVAVGFSRQEFIDYKERFQLESRPIPNSPVGANYFPVDANVSFQGARYGATIATALAGVRLGATVSIDQLTSDTENTRFFYQGSGLTATSNGIVGQLTTIKGTDTQLGWTVGALYQPHEKLSAGLAYTHGPTFRLTETNRFNPIVVRPAPLIDVAGWPKQISIDVPDRFGLGIAVRPHPRITAAIDFVRIAYSDLTRNLTVLLNENQVSKNDYIANDATEIHVGGEWLIRTGPQSVFVRGGVIRNPYHGTVFLGVPDVTTNAIQSGLFNLNSREDDLRGTLGAGLVVGSRVQVDVAYVWRREVVASTAVRF
jgi:long-subunit fatty acid transport protein